MNCTECKCILSPEQEDEILQALAEGIKPSPPICEDCIDFLERNAEDDFVDKDDY